MGKNRFTRMLALCLAVVCLVGVVSAVSWDLNNDDKVDVWDLQMAVTQSQSDNYAEMIVAALGGTDEMHPNAEGVYEIYSVMGLYNMASHAKEGATFKLMKDIDLMGNDWTPVKAFKGTFDGNNKTISNMVITKFITAGDGNSVGMFGDTANIDNETNRTEIKNLNLADLTIVIAGEEHANTRYIGGIVGTNRGDVNNCTVTCAIYDQRTKLSADNYIGSQVGRNANRQVDGKNVPNGKLTGKNSLDALEYYDYGIQDGTSKTTKWEGAKKVNSQMAMFFADLEEGSAKRNIGIAGFANGQVTTSLLIQDTTHSSKYDSQVLRDRRTRVAKEMYDMSTMYWTPSQNLLYYANGVKSGTYGEYGRKAGNVYRGLPYNHGASNMARFYGYTELGSDGLYHTTSEVPGTGYYYTSSAYYKTVNAAYEEYIKADTTAARKAELVAQYSELPLMNSTINGTAHVGFTQYIGADCSSQTLMAWRTVNATAGTGKVTATNTASMFMCNEYIASYGLVPVNNFILQLPTTDIDGSGSKNDSGDKSKVVLEYTRANKDHYMESLSCVTKGDLLMDYTNEGGHTLLAMSDAVTILKYNGTFSEELSYIVTAEQGGSGGTRNGEITVNGKTVSWSASCCVDEINYFTTLYGEGSKDPNYPACYFPITCAALQEEDTPAATVTIAMENGVVNSNFQILASSVNDGKLVYAQIQQVNHRNAYNSLNVKAVHADVKTGDTVKVLLSNGETYEFTY